MEELSPNKHTMNVPPPFPTISTNSLGYVFLEYTMSLASNDTNNNRNGTLTHTQEEAVLITKAICASLSFVSTVTFVLYVLIRSCWSFPWARMSFAFRKEFSVSENEHSSKLSLFQLIQQECFIFSRPITRAFFFLQLASAISISQVFLDMSDLSKTNQSVCILQAVVAQYFSMAKILWSFNVSMWMFFVMILQKRTNFLVLDIISFLIGWTLPSILAIVPVLTRTYGFTGIFCFLKTQGKVDRIVTLTMHTVPTCLSIVATCFLYLLIFVLVLRNQCQSLHLLHSTSRKAVHIRTSMKLYLKLIGFPIAFVLVSITPIVSQVIQLPVKSIPFWFLYLNSLSALLQGFLNTLIFVLSETIGQGCDNWIGRKNEFLNDETVSLTENDLDNESEIFFDQEELQTPYSSYKISAPRE